MDAPEAKRATSYGPLLETGRWFGALPAELRRELLERSVVKTLARGARLFARGDAPSGLFAVVDGGVRISATMPSGREGLFALAEPPMWFGEIALLDGRPRTHDAIAAEASVVVHAPQDALEALLDREPRHWRHLGALASSKLRLMFEFVEGAAVLPLGTRLAQLLVLAAERYGEWHDRSSRVVDLRQDQIAGMLSTSRQTVNQLLRELETRGRVKLAYGRVEIVDLDGLRADGTPEEP
jgi:CRP-like cAMP-binding protein